MQTTGIGSEGVSARGPSPPWGRRGSVFLPGRQTRVCRMEMEEDEPPRPSLSDDQLHEMSLHLMQEVFSNTAICVNANIAAIQAAVKKGLVIECNVPATDKGTETGKGKANAKKRKARDPSAPKRVSGYLLYSAAQRELIKAEGELHLAPKDMLTELAGRWKSLDATEKEVWKSKALSASAAPSAESAAPSSEPEPPAKKKKVKATTSTAASSSSDAPASESPAPVAGAAAVESDVVAELRAKEERRKAKKAAKKAARKAAKAAAQAAQTP